MRPQGGYIAKLCPVVIQNDVLVPDRREEVPADVLMRRQAGIDYEAGLATGMVAGWPEGWVSLDGMGWDEACDETVAAMSRGVGAIYAPNLPTDEAGRRSGRPDLLVWYQDGYVPVDIKHRGKLTASEDNSALVSDLELLGPAHAYRLDGFELRKNEGDALQLAHYRRMLEALGHAASSTLGGIIGREGLVVWYDLDEPMWRTPSTSDPDRKTKMRTSLERYDFEFKFRLDIAAAATTFKATGTGELLVEPMACSDCGGCAYRSYCFETLEAGSGDVSLIPGTQYAHWRQLRDHGLRERADVASLHYPTAELVSQGVDVEYFLRAKANHPRSAPVSVVRPRATSQLRYLEQAGITTVADLDKLDPFTAKFAGSTAGRILSARAATGPEPVYRRPGQPGTDVPRADVEIDLDMENVLEGVYLWGALLTDRSGTGSFEEGYIPFASWEELTEEVEADVFIRMWEWLTAQRREAELFGLSLHVYVWHEGAEGPVARKIADRVSEDLAASVGAFISSDQWVDLKKVFDRSWITGGSTGLKAIAPLAGFQWEVDDPGGGMAMVKYLDAVMEGSEDSRSWILDYNRGDVQATKAIRAWLGTDGHRWQEITVD